MAKVTDEIIEKIYGEIYAATRVEADAFMESFANEQPGVLGYVSAAVEALSNEEDTDLLLVLCIVAWKCFKETRTDFPEISTETIEAMHEKNVNQLLSADNNLVDWEETSIFDFMLGDVEEKELFATLTSMMLDPDDESEEPQLLIADDSQEIFFLTVKTSLDAFSQAA